MGIREVVYFALPFIHNTQLFLCLPVCGDLDLCTNWGQQVIINLLYISWIGMYRFMQAEDGVKEMVQLEWKEQ